VSALSATGPSVGPSESTRWRTVDIVVVAAIAVAFGVVFWFWDVYVWPWASFLSSPGEYAISGVWLLPAVVAPLVVRKPGAAIFAEMVAAIVSVLLGNQWGLDVLLSGFVQGAGAELLFAFVLYRNFSPLVAALAGAGAGVGEALHDLPVYYSSFDVPYQVGIVVLDVVSAAVIAGVGGWLLVRAIRRTGALQAFPASE
jgi:energy-coupling factor transport system substrate-specific component